jgi:hypothetical protein
MTSTIERPGLTMTLKVLAVVTPVLILAQAVIAGRFLFGSWQISVHGTIANLVFPLTIGIVALTLALRRPATEIAVAAVLLALVTAQLGLGYSGRESLGAAAWHIPTGVATAGAAMMLLAFQLRPAPDRRP